ncbi:MAG: uracil/xanthine transporter [Alicyclobacillus sp.]|nr:uracil/xanthine transporter [Alicyclobacillus sp.]
MTKWMVHGLASLQWLIFMFANTVVIPLSVGAAFHQTPAQIGGEMARSFVVTGLACLIQAWIGHRLPLMEGQSGLWWSVILGLAAAGSASGTPLTEIGGSISVGMVMGGLVLMVCGAFNLHKWLNRLFTPVVMAVLLFLLASQLIDIFFRGMVGVSDNQPVHLGEAALSLAVLCLVSVLTVGSTGLLSNFSILIGLVFGWLAFALFFGAKTMPLVMPAWRDTSTLFAWGPPAWHMGILLSCLVTALINTTNTIATLRAAEQVFGRPVRDEQYRRSLLLSGVYTALSGPLALVAYAPYTSSIGFLRTTRILDRWPYIMGAAWFTGIGLFPPLVGFFATLPLSIGDAVLFAAYLQLFGSALQNLEGLRLNYRTIYRVALPVLLGLAIQATPARAFTTLPGLIQPVVSNGMLMGILVAVLLEAWVPWERWDH